jgi:hypothetical protein
MAECGTGHKPKTKAARIYTATTNTIATGIAVVARSELRRAADVIMWAFPFGGGPEKARFPPSPYTNQQLVLSRSLYAKNAKV